MREIKAILHNKQTVRAKGSLYSGINDFYGNEIYENHILEITEVTDEGKKVYVTDVKWMDAALVVKSGRDDYDTWIGAWSGNPHTTHPYFELKIIGNIFDNPELLEVQT